MTRVHSTPISGVVDLPHPTDPRARVRVRNPRVAVAGPSSRSRDCAVHLEAGEDDVGPLWTVTIEHPETAPANPGSASIGESEQAPERFQFRAESDARAAYSQFVRVLGGTVDPRLSPPQLPAGGLSPSDVIRAVESATAPLRARLEELELDAKTRPAAK